MLTIDVVISPNFDSPITSKVVIWTAVDVLARTLEAISHGYGLSLYLIQ